MDHPPELIVDPNSTTGHHQMLDTLIPRAKTGIDSQRGYAGKRQQGRLIVSNVHIRRAVENIRAKTTVYTPLVEVIVNAIQAIEATKRTDGKVVVRAVRSKQIEIEDGLSAIVGFEVEDNGIGFNDTHRDSFDTLYSDLKIQDGGKGFGRLTCPKYFEEMHIRSVYDGGGLFLQRTFSLGKEHAIIVNEKVLQSSTSEHGTVVHLDQLKQGRSYEKKLSTIARTLVEKLLPYFITKGYECPEILLCENDGSNCIRLNDYTSELSCEIQEIPSSDNEFILMGNNGEEKFEVRVFKLYSPKNHQSKISLVAHKREVTGTAIHGYIPEFLDEFYEKDPAGNPDATRNYIIKAYVFSPYLDRNVSLERGEFEFQRENDLLHGISQSQIERQAAEVARRAVGDEIHLRQERKIERVQQYVDAEAPWHKTILASVNLADLPYNAAIDEIESHLQSAKFSQEIQIKREVKQLLSNASFDQLQANVSELVDKISQNSKNDLAHYIALRKTILELLSRSLEIQPERKYSSEGTVHDIIFPRKGDTDRTDFRDHNLWLIDERLNFTAYISSDLPLDGKNGERPDLLAYNRLVSFRGDNEAANPVTIFEFKRPQRDDFANPSSDEDPVEQIIRYRNDILDGKFLTPQGRNILVTDTTPFYGYLIIDLTPKLQNWLRRVKNFTPMPDGLGWFHWFPNINLYMEVWSWDKVLKDASMRNAIFFRKLGI